jgi:hypothetical protein
VTITRERMTIAAADSVLRDGSIISWIDFVVFQRRMISSVKAMCLIVYTEGKKVFGTGAIKHSMTQPLIYCHL